MRREVQPQNRVPETSLGFRELFYEDLGLGVLWFFWHGVLISR